FSGRLFYQIQRLISCKSMYYEYFRFDYLAIHGILKIRTPFDSSRFYEMPHHPKCRYAGVGDTIRFTLYCQIRPNDEIWFFAGG
ncbi:MAG: hypothetical protein ABW138_17380, partial [Candidatus Thiodiazotropha sp. 4PDIVS1]